MRLSRVSLGCGLLLLVQLLSFEPHGCLAGAPGSGGKFVKDVKTKFLPLSAVEYRFPKKEKKKRKSKFGRKTKKPKSKHGGEPGRLYKDQIIGWSPEYPLEQRPTDTKPFMLFLTQSYCHICGRVKKQINGGTLFRRDMDKFNIINPAESPDVEKFSEKDHEYQPQLRFYTSDGAPMEILGANPEFPRFFNSEQQVSWAMQRALALEREAQILRKRVRYELLPILAAHAPEEAKRFDELMMSKDVLGHEMKFLEQMQAKYGLAAAGTPVSGNPAMEGATRMASMSDTISPAEAAKAATEAPCTDCDDKVGSGWGSVQDDDEDQATGSEQEAPPPPPPPARASAKSYQTCEACVGAGFGWSPKKQKCGAGYANKACA